MLTRFLVVVPGFMGTRLVDSTSDREVWTENTGLATVDALRAARFEETVQALRFPDGNLVPAGLIKGAILALPWARLSGYSALLRALEQRGYHVDQSVRPEHSRVAYTFAYDWRDDIRRSAIRLGEAIAGWRQRHEGASAVILSHEMGGLVSRWYLERLAGSEHVARHIVVGTPRRGTPAAMQMLLTGLEFADARNAFTDQLAAHTRDVWRTFPSLYQLLPHADSYIANARGVPVLDELAGDIACDTSTRALLADARRFHAQLGSSINVDTVCYYGTAAATTSALARKTATSPWYQVIDGWPGLGDGTVPAWSAVQPGARLNTPCASSHGVLITDPTVLRALDADDPGAEVATEPRSLLATCVQDKSVYAPAETARLWVAIWEVATGSPVANARIEARLEASVGASSTASIAGAPVDARPGWYLLTPMAPPRAGVYELEIHVVLANQRQTVLRDFLVVEPRPQVQTTSELEQVQEVSLDDIGAGDSEHGQLRFDEGASNLPPTDLPSHSAAHEPTEPVAESPVGDDAGEGDETRWISVEIEGHDGAVGLRVGELYSLALWIDPLRGSVSTRLVQPVLAPDEERVDLQVYLRPDPDLGIVGQDSQRLRLARMGKSNRARFQLEPAREGQFHVTAILSKANNFVQEITLEVNVGNRPGPAIRVSQSLGRQYTRTNLLKPRNVLLIIKKRDDTHFDLTVRSEVVTEATIPQGPTQLAIAVKELRAALRQVVYLGIGPEGVTTYDPSRVDVEFPYLNGIDIPDEVASEAHKRLARAGRQLFRRMFDPPAADSHMNMVAQRLREWANARQLKIQIVSEEFTLPWGVLYVGPNPDEKPVDVNAFFGFKHIIEHIPLQQQMIVADSAIRSDRPVLNVGVNVDESLDRLWRTTLVHNQLEYWRARDQRGESVSAFRTSREALRDALRSAATMDQIMYFFGHAASGPGNERVDPEDAFLAFGSQNTLTLRDLRSAEEDEGANLPGMPLVFINACESADLSPSFYDGFMPYFMRKGARGMIGTESEVPARFAAEWARRFFDVFLNGNEPIGDVFLRLRLEFLERHNNALGLLYAVYCDGDTQVVPGVRGRSGATLQA